MVPPPMAPPPMVPPPIMGMGLGMGMGMGMMPPPMNFAMPMGDMADGPATKRQRNENGTLLSKRKIVSHVFLIFFVYLELIPEEEFANRFSGPVTVSVSIPNDNTAAGWNLNGQVLQVTIPVRSSIKELKEKLSEQLGGMPANKQQLKAPVVGFLKDNQSLAAANIGDGALLELSTRSRGGKK